MVFLLSQWAIAQPICTDLHLLVEQSTSALFTGDLNTSKKGVELIEERFKCATIPDVQTIRGDIGDYLLLKAYMAHLQQFNDQRNQWLQQVRNMEYWNPDFGLEMEMALQMFEIQPSFVLRTQPIELSSSIQLWIDGSSTTLPIEILPGIHWIWITKDDAVVWSSVDYFGVDDSLVLPIVVNHSSSDRSLLGGSVFFGVSAITAHIVASMHHREMVNANTMDDLNHSFQRSQVWGWSSIVLFGSASVFTLKWWKEQHNKNES